MIRQAGEIYRYADQDQINRKPLIRDMTRTMYTIGSKKQRTYGNTLRERVSDTNKTNDVEQVILNWRKHLSFGKIILKIDLKI